MDPARRLCLHITIITVLIGICRGETSSVSPATTSIPTTTPVPTLACWACDGLGPNNECENYDNYENAWVSMMDGDEPRFGRVRLETCSPPQNVTCIMLIYKNGLGEVAHLRGCSDNVHFGLAKDKKDRYTPLRNLTSNNETTCTWDDSNMVCLTKCNASSYCNGPQFDGSATHPLSLAVLLTNIALFMYFCTSFIS